MSDIDGTCSNKVRLFYPEHNSYLCLGDSLRILSKVFSDNLKLLNWGVLWKFCDFEANQAIETRMTNLKGMNEP